MNALRIFLPCLYLVTMAVPAMALQVTGGFTGWWGQPDQQNHGVIIVVSRLQSGEKTGVAYWAHYDNGAPSWLYAQGPIRDNAIDATVYRFDGVSFMQPQDPQASFGDPVGTMQISFSDCSTGHVSFDTETVGAGEFRIARLSNQPGMRCTGGISDDHGPGHMTRRIDAALEPTGEAPGATGSAHLELGPGRASFEVRVHDLPAGDYGVVIDGRRYGEIEAVETASGGTLGELKFGSPRVGARPLLDFDPRGRRVEITDGARTLMSALFPEQSTTSGPGDHAPFEMPTMGGRAIDFQLTNSGVYPDGFAMAELEMDPGAMEFAIELSGLPAGRYDLTVDGLERGAIEVVETDSGITRGRLAFGYPEGPGQDTFDFDPAGALIEVTEGGLVLFEGVFPDFQGTGFGGGHHDGDDGHGGGMGGGPMGPGDGDHANMDSIGIEFDNIGGAAYSGARAYAEYLDRPNRLSFDVEVEGLPAGSYLLRVDGADVGILEVTVTGGHAEIEFGDPPRFDDLLLDFDPRGALLEIKDGGETVFSVDFP